MLREAERQFKSSLMDQDMVVTYLELVKARHDSNEDLGAVISSTTYGFYVTCG